MHSSQLEAANETPPPTDPAEMPPNAPIGSGPRFIGPLRMLVVAGIVVVGALLVVVGFGKKSPLIKPIAESPSIRSGMKQSLRLKGTTEAVLARSILAPVLAGQQVETLTVTKLMPSGSRVKHGDVLAEFDRQAQLQDFIDKQADYSKLVSQVIGEQAKENAARAKDETELKQAENNLNKAGFEMQKIEIDSRIDAEKAQENSDEAKATVQQLHETFALKRKAAAAAIRILEIQRDRTRETMLHAQANAELMQIHSPIDGIVVLTMVWKQGQLGEVQEGDQIRPGVSFMEVVDPSRMQVRVLANQEDFLALQIGDLSKVHLDAYPELVFPGKLEEVAPIGRNGDFSSKLRTFAVVFSITGSDARLMPDLSAAVDVDLVAPARAIGSGQ
jgi:HlyD family secretion protein